MNKVILILDKLFLKYEGMGGRQIDPPSPLPGKTTFKKPSLIRVKTFRAEIFSSSIFSFFKMKHLNSQVKEGKIHLEAIPGAKASQLNHYVVPTLEELDYDCAIIHVGINDILRSKDMSELKEFPKKIMQIGTTC